MNGSAAATTHIRPRRGLSAFDRRDLWRHREVLYFLTWRDIKVRYKQTALGVGWAVLQPVMGMLVFSLFFGRLARLPTDGIPHPVFYLCGLLPWTYFANALSAATTSVVQHQQMIKKVYFPRVMLPVSAVTGFLVDFLPALACLAVVLVVYDVAPGARVLWLPAFLALGAATALAAGLWLASLHALYRDVRFALPFLVQFWLFASPVAYPASLVPERWQAAYALNPLTTVISGVRWAVTGQGRLDPAACAVSLAVVVVALAGGFLYFAHVDQTVADVV